jgi:hypothetical protein
MGSQQRLGQGSAIHTAFFRSPICVPKTLTIVLQLQFADPAAPSVVVVQAERTKALHRSSGC